MGESQPIPTSTVATRYYDSHVTLEYEPPLLVDELQVEPLRAALESFGNSVGELEFDDESTAIAQREDLARWSDGWRDELDNLPDLDVDEVMDRMDALSDEAEERLTAFATNDARSLEEAVQAARDGAERGLILGKIDSLVESSLPVCIYFEDYGVLDSAIWFPGFHAERQGNTRSARVRTINAMFRHASLDADEIADLGSTESARMQLQGQQPSPQQIETDRQLIERRSILLSAASSDISRRFSDWWSQRRHRIEYDADGDYFRIWVADDVRPDVRIELESRSKGFQWFFSFYLVFLVESEDGHKDALLLLDEPGLHLHPTAQQELIAFFETLSETNQIAYTTHSPFLIDGERLHRVRPVTEDDSGHSSVTTDAWPENRETIFPLQAAAGYAMIQSLFAHRNNVLVEGMSDFYYLHALSEVCSATGRPALPEGVYITPCGGVRNVSPMASLFLGHDARPLVLLDGDDAGRARQNALLKDLYAGHELGILMLDDALGRPGQEVEVEDILGEEVLLEGLGTVLGEAVSLADDDAPSRSLPSRIEAAAQREGLELPEDWKAAVARQLVSSWAENRTTVPDDVLDNAAGLFAEISSRFDE